MSTTTPAPYSDPAGTWNRRYGCAGFLFGTRPNAWLREYEADLSEGAGHSGRSALVGLIGRRPLR